MWLFPNHRRPWDVAWSFPPEKEPPHCNPTELIRKLAETNHLMITPLTKSIDNISSEKASSSKNSCGMSYPGSISFLTHSRKQRYLLEKICISISFRHRSQYVKAYLPPCTLIIGFPVLVMWTSEASRRCCRDNRANWWAGELLEKTPEVERHCLEALSDWQPGGFMLGRFSELKKLPVDIWSLSYS